MKILFFTDHFRPEPSAPAAHIYERARLWVQWGHEVTVITSAPNFPTGKVYPGYQNRWHFVEEMAGIRVVRVKTFLVANEGFVLRTLDYMSYVFPALFSALREEKPDVAISSSPHLFTAVTGVLYARLRRVPHVFEIRDLWPKSIVANSSIKPGRIYRLLEKLELFLYRKSKRILSFTHSYVEDLTARGVPVEKIDVVINGANLELFSPRPRDGEIDGKYRLGGRFVVGYLGTVGLSSGLENVIHAAELLRDTRITFFIVGVGAAKQTLEVMAREHGLSNVVFADRQLKEDMPRFWSVCDASLIHLRDSEVFKTVIPSKIFESMAMGMPIIYVVPEGEGAAIVRQHEAGVCVPPAQPAALAAAVRELANDPERQSLFRANSLKAAPRYSREQQAKGTIDVLQRAVSGQREVP